MIICSCNRLSDKDLRRGARAVLDRPEGGVVTPGAVFRALGCRPRCGGCFPRVIEEIHQERLSGDNAARENPCTGCALALTPAGE